VLSFPILTDIYSAPIIAELANVYPVSSPIVSIPKISISAITKSYDGLTTTERKIPTSKHMIRANTLSINVAPGTAVNAFTAATISADTFKMNRRYALVTSVRVTETDSSSATHVFDTNINIRPDNRSQIVGEIQFNDSAGAEVNLSLNGHINYNNGNITLSGIITEGTGTSTYTFDYGTFSLRFTPVSTMNGRTVVKIVTEMTDVTIDENEDFLIDLPQETIQDYKSIFKIDVMRTLSEAIKRQILLNKDQDLAFFLGASDSDIAKNNASLTLDLNNFATSNGDYNPTSIMDILKNITPKIATLMGIIYSNFNMYPKYLITGLKTAALLRSLQDMMVNIPSRQGELGWSGSNAQFLKLKVLETTSIPDNKMYLSTKAPSNALEKTSIVDLIYNPLYIVKETTDGNTRHFVRARTMVEIARTEGLGLITINNIDTYLG